MIRRLELRWWRAFDHISIEFQPGTTFLVAPNGVGKTSLLLGLTWALFGERSRVAPADCIRLGHDNAEAIVEVGIGDSSTLVISRSVTTKNKTTVAYKLDNDMISREQAEELLVKEFGAPLDVAARVAVIRGSGRDDGDLDLQEHLYDAFGVSDLRAAAAAATQLNKQAVAARKALRSESKALLTNREQLADRERELSTQVDESTTRRADLLASVREAREQQNVASAWAQYEAAVSQRALEVTEVLARESGSGRIAGSIDELTNLLAGEIDATGSAIAHARAELTDARAQQLAAQAALDLLRSHDPECPTCARPFHGDELDKSIALQQRSLTVAEDRISQLKSSISDYESELARSKGLHDVVSSLAAPIPEPVSPRPPRDHEALLIAAEENLRRHDEMAGAIARERDAVAAQLHDDEAMRAASAAERSAWRREALTQATAAALTATAERIAQEHIEPLSQQVRWRWKALFGDDGLQLRADGSIVRVVGDREIPWHLLSSGEQIWSRLVASLLVLQSSTRLPFAWLDEPLEHLDPRARRIVAGDLAKATSSGRPAQLIVTTYEHEIARQLSQDVDNASLVRINRTDRPVPVTRG